MDLDAMLRRALMRLPPERAHGAALQLLSLVSSIPGGCTLLRKRYAPNDHPVEICGLTFRNRVGLAAGYDKNAVAVAGLDALGFGHLELGTVTPRAQPGNLGARIQRFVEHEALVNRLGFPSLGEDVFAERLQRAKNSGLQSVIGVNLGKNQSTPNPAAVDDYLSTLQRIGPLADYVTVNVSSPNTKGLRALANPKVLDGLIRPLVDFRDANKWTLPIWVKLSPDDAELEDAARVAVGAGADALVVSNTTISRPAPIVAEGGLSGRPLCDLALAALVRVRSAVHVPIIAVGGIFDADDVARRVNAGADLVQVYTALVYRGPHVLRDLTG